MGKLKSAIGNLLFPGKCVFCGTLLSLGTNKEHAVCAACEKKLPYCVALPRCKACGKPVEEPAVYCELCRKTTKRPYAKMSAPYLYREPVKGSVVRFKRERQQGYAKVYARHMQAVLDYDCTEKSFDVAVSVPPRKKRMREEGYDQAACLAQELAKRMGIPYFARVLKQKENRKKQSDLTAAERYRNARGNYLVCKPAVVREKTVLLIDDVCTTGATLAECARVLREVGAAKVYCATAATAEKR